MPKWEIIKIELTMRIKLEKSTPDEEVAEDVVACTMDGYGYPYGAEFTACLVSRRDADAAEIAAAETEIPT